MGRLTSELYFGDVRATCVKYSLGGEAVFVLTASNCADESELVLNAAEAKALHEWLGRAVAASSQETREIHSSCMEPGCGRYNGEHAPGCPARNNMW